MCDCAVLCIQLYSLGPVLASQGNGLLAPIAAPCKQPADTLQLTHKLFSCLGRAGVLAERDGAFPKAACAALQASMDEISRQAGGSASPAPDLQASMQQGMHNCLYWLYGVRLPGVDEDEWAAGAVMDDAAQQRSVTGPPSLT